MRYRLQVLSHTTGAVDQEWILHLPATVGRSPDVDVPIGDASISRRHCQFFLNSSDALSVRDMKSLNGTYIDDQRIDNRAVIQPGDIVRIGSVCLKLEWTEDELTDKPSRGQANVETTQPMRTLPNSKAK